MNRPESGSPPTRRAAYAQLLFLLGVVVFGVGLFVPILLLRTACLWVGALLAGVGLLIWPAASRGDKGLRLLLALSVIAILLRIVTGYSAFGVLVIALAIGIGLVAGWMRYTPRRK